MMRGTGDRNDGKERVWGGGGGREMGRIVWERAGGDGKNCLKGVVRWR